MAMTADSSANHHSPGRKNLSSPWAQVLRGELEAPSASDQPPSPMRHNSTAVDIEAAGSFVSPLSLADEGQHIREGSNNGDAASASSKKPAWNKPSISSTTVEAAVMGDDIAWPALSEAIRSSPKVQSADPPAPGSNSGFQARPVVNSLKKPAPNTNHPVVNLPKKPAPNTNHPIVNSPKKPAPNSNHLNHVISQDHTVSARQKTGKHVATTNSSNSGGNNNSKSNISSGLVQSNFTNAPPVVPPPPPFPILVGPGPNGYGNFIPPLVNPSINQPYKVIPEGRPGFMPQSHAMSDRSSSRRGNFGSRPRSDGHRGGHGGRHDHDRSNYRGNRDVNVSMQRTSHRGGFVRTPPSNALPFFPPHGVQPFRPRPFPDFYYPGMHMEPYRAGGPFFPSAVPVPMLIPVAEDPSVPIPILNQINYYFSDDNLVKDEYLKKHMDAEGGWVHISLIANFPRVKSLTTDENLILQTMKSSTIVEVQGEKLRRRNDWKKWLVRPSAQVSSESGSPSSVGSAYNALATSLQKMTVEEMPLSNGPEKNV